MVGVTVVKNFNHFPRLAAGVRPKVVDVLNKAVDDLSARADPRTPVEKGLLKGNKRRHYATVSNLNSRLHWLQHYAAHQEFGTVRGIAPKKFARDSFQDVVPGTTAGLAAAVEGKT